jgi:cell wall-associated NlpC family hydrolase
MNIEKYIGIPYIDHGRTFDGCDCYGLVRLFLENEFDIFLPDFWAYESHQDHNAIVNLIDTNQQILTDEISKKEILPGDIVLYRYYNAARHIGVYIGNGLVLHTSSKTDSVCVPYESTKLKGKVYGFYRIKSGR